MNFLTIILGTDINAYGVARSIHEAYGIKSLALGKKPLSYTRGSKIVDVEVTKGFDEEPVFLKKLEEIAQRFKNDDRKLLLIPCSDGYNALVSKNKEKLSQDFIFNVVDYELQKKLENKVDFYKICEKYNLDYPATYIIDPSNYKNFEIPFEYPIALKPNDSISYLSLDFEGKKKAYKINDEDELKSVLERIYNTGYTEEMIAQDFIPGNASSMYVLNAYVSQAGDVKLMCLGKCLLDECLPTEIGNYNALVSMGDGDIYTQYEEFLERIGYRGYANFDLKYDYRDGKYKIFEINMRLGRSSYYMNTGGCNYMTYIVDDLILNKERDTHYHYDQALWLYVDPYVLRKYVDEKDQSLAEEMLKKGFEFTQWYKQDRSIIRFLDYIRRRISTIRYYPMYEPPRKED